MSKGMAWMFDRYLAGNEHRYLMLDAAQVAHQQREADSDCVQTHQLLPVFLQSGSDFPRPSRTTCQRFRFPRSGSGVEIRRCAGYCRMNSIDFSGGAVSHSSYWCSCRITTMRFSSPGLWKCLNSS